jgi:two-component system, NtrC family, sensor kinase
MWLLALIASTFALGVLDYVTGPRLSFSLFYLAPVALGGWMLGVRAAWVLTATVSLAQFSADFAWGGQEVSLITLWNAFTRIGVLGALGHLVAWLRRDRDRLDHLLAERTSAHVATVDQLRHRDRLALVGQIASGLAHELGTPLNVVDGRARLMAEADLKSEERSAHVRSILEQTERMTRIIRQLLDFARRRGPDVGRVDLHDLCSRVLELLRPLASKRAVELKLLPVEGDGVAAVDYNQIQQAISNLVMNAVQAMPEGGEVTVRIAGAAEEDLMVSVSDTGMGIAKEDLARIFEPFFTTQGAGQGTGLGLSITEGIVKDHGGSIEVTSEVGRGSCFTLRVPRVHSLPSKEPA